MTTQYNSVVPNGTTFSRVSTPSFSLGKIYRIHNLVTPRSFPLPFAAPSVWRAISQRVRSGIASLAQRPLEAPGSIRFCGSIKPSTRRPRDAT
jgi:hypothetical protein